MFGEVTCSSWRSADRPEMLGYNDEDRAGADAMLTSSTSKINVAPPGISGGRPPSPYAISDGQVRIAFSPTFIRPTPSVQHLMTPLSGNVAGSPRLRELSNTVPSTSFPSYCTVTRSVGPGEAPVP